MQRDSDKSPSCGVLLIMLLPAPFIAIGVSALDAWAIRTVLVWLTPWRMTFTEAFALSMLTGLLCHQFIYHGDGDVMEHYFGSLMYTVLTPLIVVLTVAVGRWVGWL